MVLTPSQVLYFALRSIIHTYNAIGSSIWYSWRVMMISIPSRTLAIGQVWSGSVLVFLCVLLIQSHIRLRFCDLSSHLGGPPVPSEFWILRVGEGRGIFWYRYQNELFLSTLPISSIFQFCSPQCHTKNQMTEKNVNVSLWKKFIRSHKRPFNCITFPGTQREKQRYAKSPYRATKHGCCIWMPFPGKCIQECRN